MVLSEFLKEWRDDSPTVTVKTSGSTGIPKQIAVEKNRMVASARITCDFLGLKRGDSALLCMPLDYIAGKMMVVRSEVCGLRLISVEPSGRPLQGLEEVPDFAAMTPMQVYNTLSEPEERLMLTRIRHLIIGGGVIDDGMAAELRTFPNAVWSTYGMTETLSHIAMRRLSGSNASEWYTPFESVGVSVNADGCLIIDAPKVCDDPLTTRDIAEILPDGRRFRIVGRLDNVINSGGIKIQAEEVERLLRPHIRSPFIITKRKDAKFGEAVALLMQSVDVVTARNVCRRVLPHYWIPRYYISVTALPVTETGKPARKTAEEIACKN